MDIETVKKNKPVQAPAPEVRTLRIHDGKRYVTITVQFEYQ